jgi:hypothetical protein
MRPDNQFRTQASRFVAWRRTRKWRGLVKRIAPLQADLAFEPGLGAVPGDLDVVPDMPMMMKAPWED